MEPRWDSPPPEPSSDPFESPLEIRLPDKLPWDPASLAGDTTPPDARLYRSAGGEAVEETRFRMADDSKGEGVPADDGEEGDCCLAAADVESLVGKTGEGSPRPNSDDPETGAGARPPGEA